MDGHAFSNTMKPESVIPVAPLPVFELPLEKHSEKTFDDKLPQATQTGVTLTSKGKARLVFCEEKK
jgi:hypothetical protein